MRSLHTAGFDGMVCTTTPRGCWEAISLGMRYVALATGYMKGLLESLPTLGRALTRPEVYVYWTNSGTRWIRTSLDR